MCYGCYLEYGAPKMRSRSVRRMAEIIRTEPDLSWGALHIVVEDENLETDDIDWCLKRPEITAREMEVGTLLRYMTLKQRASAFGLARGYFK